MENYNIQNISLLDNKNNTLKYSVEVNWGRGGGSSGAKGQSGALPLTITIMIRLVNVGLLYGYVNSLLKYAIKVCFEGEKETLVS